MESCIDMMVKKNSGARYCEEERRNLPVWVQKEEFVRTLKENQMVLVTGETGSGKTTQIPQFVLESVMDENSSASDQWLVGCTQPHRVAAMCAARRVAEEMDVKMGEEVGYTVRFEDCSSPRTVLKYLTDVMLLREAMVDPLLLRYKVIILDEFHDRSLATDLLVAILNRTLFRRPDLKLVVMSATLERLKQKYFSDADAPLIKVPCGRLLHPVEILYTREPVMDYLETAISKVIEIHMCEPTGDVLVFLTGEEEIEHACSRIVSSLGDQVTVVPLYSSLPPALQQKIFDPTPPPHSVRKIIVSTNVAETSLSMDGIAYVVDPGFSKQKNCCFFTANEIWSVSRISKASAYQRAGRAGRKCFRLYTEKTFNDLPAWELPEIFRSNLVKTVLTLMRLGVREVTDFEFIDFPSPQMLYRGLEDLFHLGAIDDQGNLTNIGHMMETSLEEPL
ncbi:RNA helicase family protein [Raphanus sativus]|uniref:RNA helicase n=1 Tax=Raphanus sativus TaxID=3726 RepID=A0A6J0N5R4_RAPSA|nr:probable pre-mRNA-splicing factor ATP-dependent RNA helicase DEAH2 [Raphanus sativus]KAJ4904141.1 RNA helicase family protein [Raphanus sativus]